MQIPHTSTTCQTMDEVLKTGMEHSHDKKGEKHYHQNRQEIQHKKITRTITKKMG